MVDGKLKEKAEEMSREALSCGQVEPEVTGSGEAPKRQGKVTAIPPENQDGGKGAGVTGEN
jgi:hypothetical protein